MTRLPSFTPAEWRGTTNTDGQVIGISFNLEDGSIVRVKLGCASARHCAESILGYLDGYTSKNSQPESAAGICNTDVSGQSE